jgi:type IV pilus assembly protein PilM
MNLPWPPPTVGVDLGRRAIKLVAVQGGLAPRVVHAVRLATPEGVIDGGVIRDAAGLTTALRDALRRGGIGRSRAVVGIQGRMAVVRTFLVPPMPDDELKNAVRWEAERQLPLRIEEAVLDAQVARHVTEDGQRRLEVLMAAVPERDALAYYQVAHDAGLDVAAIEVSSLALARALASADAPAAAVDIGLDTTEVVIAHRDLPPVCRTLQVGGAQLPMPAAENTGAPGWRDLLEGVARSIDYFQTQARIDRIERVVVTGEGEALSAVADVLKTELGVPVALGDPLARLAVAHQLNGDLRDPVRRAAYAVAVGLALRTAP